MFYKNKKLKIFLSLFIVLMILLSLLMPYFEEDSYYAATVIKSSETTKKKKTVGHKVEGAEYYDELWEKFSVIAVDNGGGSGEGGGAGDNNTSNAGNGGAYDDAGGIFGQAVGDGKGTGITQNKSGTGSGTTGSATADRLRQLREYINESNAESRAKEIETAKDAELAAASIAARESIQASIQKRLIQESVKASIEAAEFQRQLLASLETRIPTSARRDSYGAYDNKIPPSRARTTARTQAVETVRSNIIVREETIAPQVNDSNYYDLNSLSPSVNNELITQYDNNIAVPIPNEASYYENNDSNVPTSIVEYVENNMDAPTSALEEMPEIFNTVETFDSPLVNEESSVVEEEKMTEATTMEAETENKNDDDDGKGSRGGKDQEADEDLKGKEEENESEGNANEKGKYQLETEGEFAGKKVFELKQNGNIGFEPEHLSVAGLKNFMISGVTLLLLVGALLFTLGSDGKMKKNNYF